MTVDGSAAFRVASPSCVEGPRSFAARCAAVALSLLLALVGLAGCAGGTGEEVISNTLTGELDKVKALDGELIAKVASNMDVDRFNDYGIDSSTFIRAYFDGFDYAIDSIDVDEGSARAQVTLTCKSFSDFRTKLKESSDAMAANADEYASKSREEIAAIYGALLMETLQQVSLAPTKPVAFTFELVDNTWRMKENFESTIASSLLTN